MLRQHRRLVRPEWFWQVHKADDQTWLGALLANNPSEFAFAFPWLSGTYWQSHPIFVELWRSKVIFSVQRESQKETFQDAVTEKRSRFLLTRVRPPWTSRLTTLKHWRFLTPAVMLLRPCPSFLVGCPWKTPSFLFSTTTCFDTRQAEEALFHSTAVHLKCPVAGRDILETLCGAARLWKLECRLGLWALGHRSMKWTKPKSVFQVNLGELRKSDFLSRTSSST